MHAKVKQGILFSRLYLCNSHESEAAHEIWLLSFALIIMGIICRIMVYATYILFGRNFYILSNSFPSSRNIHLGV
jgi:hypothetical protein